MTDTTSPVVAELAALTVQARRIADALTAPLPGEDGLPVSTCPRTDRHGYHLWADADRTAICPGHPAPPVDVAAAMTGDTPAGNAEDCPRCGEECAEGHIYAGRCQQGARPIPWADSVGVENLGPEPDRRPLRGRVSVVRATTRTTPDNPPTSTDTPDNPDDDRRDQLADWIWHYTNNDGQLLTFDDPRTIAATVLTWPGLDQYDHLEGMIRTVERVRDGVIRHRDQLAARAEKLAGRLLAAETQIADLRGLTRLQAETIHGIAVERERAEATVARVQQLLDEPRGLIERARLRAALDGTSPAAAEGGPDGDTCRPVEVDGEAIRVHGGRPLIEEERGYFGEVIAAAKRKFAAEQPVVPADTGQESALTRRIRAQQRGEPGPAEAQPTCTATLNHPDDGLIRCDADHGDWRIPTLHCGSIPGAESPAANRLSWRDTDPGTAPHTDITEDPA